MAEEAMNSAILNADSSPSRPTAPRAWVAFAIGQPDEVDVNEILFRPTAQEY